MTLIYLHGFQSSSQSAKGTLLRDHMRRIGWDGAVELPTLPPRPLMARDWLRQKMESGGEPVQGILGSSLGGCYAHWLAGTYGVPVALINPAVRAGETMRQYLGQHENPYTGEVFELTEEDMDALGRMDGTAIADPDRILCMLEKGDDVLDWRQAADRYRSCALLVHEGGSHAYDNFAADIPRILQHFSLQI